MARQTYTVIDSKANKVTNVADPTVAQDAATKYYVDTNPIFLKNGDWTMTTNTFGGRKLWQSDLHNALFLADKRWTVTGNFYNNAGDTLVRAMNAAEIAGCFDGDYESSTAVPLGQYIVVNITFAPYFPAYPYGYIYVSSYYTNNPASVSMRMYCDYAPQTVGWKTLTVSEVVGPNQIMRGRNDYYNMAQLEITFKSPNAGNTANITAIDFSLDRPGNANEMPYLDKYRANKLYFPLNISFAGSQLRLTDPVGPNIPLTVTATGNLEIGRSASAIAAEIPKRIRLNMGSGGASYAESGVFIKNMWSGTGIALHAIGTPNDLYVTTEDGTPAGYVAGRISNPYDGSKMTIGPSGAWYITDNVGGSNVKFGIGKAPTVALDVVGSGAFTGTLSTGSVVGDRIYLYGTSYGLGIQSGELASFVGAAGDFFTWRVGSSTGTEWARMSQSGLQIKVGALRIINSDLTPYTSGSIANDALKVVSSSNGAAFGVQNSRSDGFSGIEYMDQNGVVKVFTGHNNASPGEFRFNNISGGTANIRFKTNSVDRLILTDSGATVTADPTVALGIATKQYVDVNFAAKDHTHASTTEFRWTYDSPSTMADPGTGKIRTNTASGVPSTQATVSEITALGVDASSVLKSLTTGDLIYFQQLNNADNWGRYTVDGALVDNGAWWLIPIKAVEQHGAAIAKNQDVIVRFTYGGGGGAGGIGGIEIFAQPVAPGPSTTDLFWLDVDDTSVQGSQFWRAWKGTQAAYDAISTKDPDTLYVVT